MRALWLTPEELRAAQARHRSPLVWRAVEDLPGAGRRARRWTLLHGTRMSPT